MAEATRFAGRYWRYSLTAYAATNVQSLCLRLQDEHAANVNLLLLGGFFGHLGQMLEAQDWFRIAEHITPFNRRYTQPIRNLRQRVQLLAADECYQQLKALELQAEQLEQHIIAIACTRPLPQQKCVSGVCLADNRVLQNLLAYRAGWPLRSTEAAHLVRELAVALCCDDQIQSKQALQ